MTDSNLQHYYNITRNIIIQEFIIVIHQIQMQPKAVLVLYQPGCKLKNSKYLLAIGPNIVGRDDKCQVIINSKDYFCEQYVANFYLTDDFLYIEALCDNMVQIKSNIQIQNTQRKKQVFKHIEKSCRYVLPIEEIFYIGPYKAIVQVLAPQQLLNIKNLLNLSNFETPRQMDEQQIQKTQKNQDFEIKSDGTQKIQSQNQQLFQQTLILNDYDACMFQPTLLLDEHTNLYHSQPKNQIPTNQIHPNNESAYLSKQKQSQKYSQEILYNTIRKEEIQLRERLQEQDDVSMADTVRDQVKLESQGDKAQSQEEMPPTLQDDYEPNFNNQTKDISSKLKPAKSFFIGSVGQKPQTLPKLYHSEIQHKQLQEQQQQWGSMFGKQKQFSKSIPFQLQNLSKQQKPQQIKGKLIKTQIFLTRRLDSINSSIEGLNISKNNSSNLLNASLDVNQQVNIQKSAQRKSDKDPLINNKNGKITPTRLIREDKKLKIANFSGFKPKPEQRLILRQRGYQTVPQGKSEQYDMLIIGNSYKPTVKLLTALLLQKQIVSQDWLHQKQWQQKAFIPSGQILGIPWSLIMQKKDSRKVFSQSGPFHLTQSLKQYTPIMQLSGAALTTDLNKRKKILFIMNCQVEKDQTFYRQNQKFRHWWFYDYKIIAESILTGEVGFDKYQVDGTSF